MSYTTDGLVLNVRAMGENDRLLTLLTPVEGRINVIVKGGRSLRSGSLSSTLLFAYGNYEINDRNGYKWLKGGSTERSFIGLSSSIEKLSLASYLAEVATELSGENESAQDMLRLMLNCFYAIDNEKKPKEQVKGAFELRAAAIEGFMPELSACRGCGKTVSDIMYLDVMNGRILCSDCMHKAALESKREKERSEDIREAEILIPLSPSVLSAMRYVITAEPNRFLAFNLSDEEMPYFAKAAETYLLSHIGHGYDTLEFYKRMV